MVGEFLGFFEGEHVAAVFKDFQFRAGNFLRVEFTDAKGQKFVLAAPDEEGWAFDAMQMLR